MLWGRPVGVMQHTHMSRRIPTSCEVRTLVGLLLGMMVSDYSNRAAQRRGRLSLIRADITYTHGWAEKIHH